MYMSSSKAGRGHFGDEWVNILFVLDVLYSMMLINVVHFYDKKASS